MKFSAQVFQMVESKQPSSRITLVYVQKLILFHRVINVKLDELQIYWLNK